MTLQVVIGAANAGKTGALYGRLRSAALQSHEALLLLPSPADVARAMGELSTDFPAGLQITTLGAHLDGYWRAYGDGRRLIAPVERALMLEESGNIVDPGCLSDSVGTTGFRRLLSSLVQRAAESEQFERQRALRFDTPGDRLLAYIDAYRTALSSAGLIERAEAHRLLAAAAGRLALPRLVAVGGFTGLTGPQERYLSAISRFCDVVIALTYDPTVPATESAKGLVARLAAGAAAHAVTGKADNGAPPELTAIERGLGGPIAASVHGSGAVVISEAWGRGSEAARIVREIQNAFEAGFPPEAVVVVFRDPATHISSLRLALAEAGIVADWDVQVPFERTGIGRCLLNLMMMCAGTADRVTWMDVMRSPYSPCSSRELDELDARIRRMGVSGAAAARRLESWVSGEGARFIHQARAAYRGLGDASSATAWHGITSSMLGLAHPPAATLDLDGMLDAAAVRVLVEAVAALESISGRASAQQALAAALQGSPVSVGASGETGRIQVTSAERVRGRRFDCVIVGGLTAGEFPRVRRDDGFGAYGAEAALARAGIDVAPRDDIAAERLLFYQVVTRARRRLVLSRRSHDDEGQPLHGSVFIDEVLDLYAKDRDTSESGSGVLRRTLGPDTGLLEDCAPHTDRRIARSDVRAACVLEEGAAAGAFTDDAVGQSWLSAETRASLAAQEVFSVSDIETYLQCPYRWYIERVIRPSDLDESTDASTAGRIAHAVLAHFYERLPAAHGVRRLTSENLDTARSLYLEIVDEVGAAVRTGSAQEKAMMRRAVAGTWRILAADARLFPGFEPRYCEWSFGMDDDPERFEGFALRGRVDRIDVCGDLLCVTDYKLGGLSASHGVVNLVGDGRVQLPLYALVASRRLGLSIGAGLYRSITRDTMRGFVAERLADKAFVATDIVNEAGLESILEEAQALAAGAVAGMRAGAIDPEPADGRCAPYCAARGFCPGRGAAHA
jgi:RecB family exonuclease